LAAIMKVRQVSQRVWRLASLDSNSLPFDNGLVSGLLVYVARLTMVGVAGCAAVALGLLIAVGLKYWWLYLLLILGSVYLVVIVQSIIENWRRRRGSPTSSERDWTGILATLVW